MTYGYKTLEDGSVVPYPIDTQLPIQKPMTIKHYPVTKIEQVEKFYSEKDGVEVKHVCSTEFGDAVADIFYRSTPHPKFGNKYFCLFFRGDDMYVANADYVEKLTFGMVENDEGQLEYSQSRHDYKSFKNGNMIDGGRDYIRSSGKVKVFTVKDGKMVNFSTGNDNG